MRWVGIVVLLAVSAVCTADSARSEPGIGDYSLDALPRSVSVQGPMRCPKVAMQRYTGTTLRYHKPVLVYEDFASHLARFEAIAAEVAEEIYGRRPRRIVHIGTYNCRRIRKIPDLLSEHGIANAIDVEGFDFGPARSAEEREASPEKRLRRGFQVRIQRHWSADESANHPHARFLRRLTDRLQEDDVFRVLLGPAYPGHKDHFHFDMAPYRLVVL